jgi:hypothetical protein
MMIWTTSKGSSRSHSRTGHPRRYNAVEYFSNFKIVIKKMDRATAFPHLFLLTRTAKGRSNRKFSYSRKHFFRQRYVKI